MSNTVVVNVQANTSAATADITTTTVAVDNLTKANKKLNNETEQVASGFEDVTKNGGAIAILDQLTGGLASRVRDTFEATKLFNFSLKGMRTALIATGIGAFVVLLGTVVAYWDEITDFINGATRDLEKQRAEYERINKQLDTEISLLTQQKELLELQGKPTQEITNELRKQLLLQQEINLENLKTYENQLEQEKTQNKQLTWWESIKAAVVFRFDKEKGIKLVGESIKEDSEETAETEAKIKEIKDKQFEISKKLLIIDKEATEEVKKRSEFLEEIRLGMVNTEEEKRAEELNKLDVFYDDLIRKAVDYYGVLSEEVAELETTKQEVKTALTLKHAEEDAAIQKAIDEKEIADAKIVADAKIDIAKKEEAAKVAALNGYANALSGISGVIGQETQAAKGLAIASSLVNTYAAISGQLKAFSGVPVPGYAIAQAIATGVVGLANVKKIASVKIPNSSGGSSAPNISSISASPAQAPSFNIVGQGEGSQIASALGEQQQTPVQAFVVSQDVTTAQSLENGIIQGATLGG